MTENLKQKIKEQLSMLPQRSQEAINSFDWISISEKIGKKYFFADYEINNLQVVTALTVLGLERQDVLAINIENEVGTTKEEALKIAEEISQKILNPIIENLLEKIKNTLKERPTHWQQNLNFILSGGDYTAFIREPISEKREELSPKPATSFNPSKIDDLKSKFTI